MPTIYKEGESWYLRFQLDGRHRRRSLGRITEAQAQQRLEAANRGDIPYGTIDSLKLTSPELKELHRKSLERARERSLPHLLTRADIVTMYNRSGGRCEVSGIPFNRHKLPGWSKRPWYVSIDRVDSKQGYVLANCRLVCTAVNVAMGEWGLETLGRIARAIAFRGDFSEITPNSPQVA